MLTNRSSRGKTRLAKWYAPYNDEEKIKLKGEVSPPFLPPPILSLHLASPRASGLPEPQLNSSRSIASSPPATKSTNPTLLSSDRIRSSTGDTQASSSVRASTQTITSSRIWRPYTFLSRCWIAFLGTCVSWIWCLIFIRCVLLLLLGLGGIRVAEGVNVKEDGRWGVEDKWEER
jgi:hypothetical protein